MKTALRILAGLVGLLVVAILAAAMILPLVVDPNDYRERIAQEVHARTGRTLTLAGPIGLSVFPWLGLSLEDAALGNAPGFGTQPFVAVKEARVKARALPLLLRRELQVDTVVLREPRIRLAVDRHGRSNWQDLAGDAGSEKEKPPRGDGAAPVGNVVLGGVEISAGEVTYEDQRSGAVTRVRDLDLEVGRLAPGEQVPVKLDAIVEASGPGIVADVKLETRLEGDPQAQRYTLSGLAAAAVLKGEGLPKDGLPVALTGEARADLAAGTARVPKLTLAVLDASLTGSGEVRGLDDAKPVFAGTLELAPFSPRKVMEALGTQVETADAAVLGSARARLALRAGADAIEVRELDAQLDDTTAAGTLSVGNFDAPRVRFDLKVGALDLDRYLAPGATQTPQARGGGEPRPAAPPPEPGLRLDELGARLGAMDLSGTLALASLKAAKVRLTDVNVTLRGKDGTVQADPLRAALYEGSLSGAIGLDARPARPVVTARQTLSGVALAPLLKDLGQRESLTGRADIALDVRASGQVAAELTQTLDGTLRAAVADGVLKGINVDRAICQARAAVDTARGREREACDPSPDSRFETLQVSGTFTDGVLRSDDLLIVQPRHEAGEFYRVTGAGTVSLPRQEVDYQLRAVRTRQRDGDATAQEKGRAIPVRVAGTFGDLSVRPDTRALAEGEVKEQLQDRFGDKLETKDDDSDLERQGKELLKGLLGQ